MSSVLIIDDDASYLKSMKLILETEGFAVQTAENGVAGLALAHRYQPDLILCDIMMPGMDGHSVLELLNSDSAFADVPFIFVTAMAERAEVRRGMCEGADDYLTKPFSAEELVAAVVSRLYRIGIFCQQGEKTLFQDEVAILRQNTSDREREILMLVGQGITSKDIAKRLNLCRNTVEVHRASMMRKLDAPNAASLARWAFIAEQLPPPVK